MKKRSQLTPRAARTLTAAAEIILPGGGAIPFGHADIDIHGFVNDYLTVVPLDVSRLVRFILFFLEYGAFLFALSPSRFSKMTPARRMAALDGIRTSRLFFLRGFFILLSSVILIPFYRDTRVMDAIGYRGYKPNSNKVDLEQA